MRKWMLIWVGLGLILMGRVAVGANQSAWLGMAIGLSLGLLLALLAANAGDRLRNLLQLTRLDEQILSDYGQVMPVDLADASARDLDLVEAWMLAMHEENISGYGDHTRRFEQVEDLPRVEFLTEFTR